MRLYVWQNVLTDYTSGMIFCIAKDLDSAREAFRQKFKEVMKIEIFGDYEKDIMKIPLEFDLSIPRDDICYFVFGGG